MSDMSTYTVVFEPIGRKGECQDGESILYCARRLGIGISSVCGGKGTCGTCRIQVTDGTLSDPSPDEQEAFSPQELDDDWRLACNIVSATFEERPLERNKHLILCKPTV